MQVKWLPDALEDLDQIISYCTEQFGQEVAFQFYEKVEKEYVASISESLFRHCRTTTFSLA